MGATRLLLPPHTVTIAPRNAQVERSSNMRALKGKAPYKRLPVDLRERAREGRADPDEVGVWVLIEESPGAQRSTTHTCMHAHTHAHTHINYGIAITQIHNTHNTHTLTPHTSRRGGGRALRHRYPLGLARGRHRPAVAVYVRTAGVCAGAFDLI